MSEASTHQKTWDACLIKSWREFKTMGQAAFLFHSITGIWPNQTTLLRYSSGMPHQAGVRMFVGEHLVKLNEILHKYDRSKDVEILRKLQASKMDCVYQRSQMSLELRRVQKSVRSNSAINKLEHTNYMNRNQNTDWGVTK
jgi:hypothetical protein